MNLPNLEADFAFLGREVRGQARHLLRGVLNAAPAAIYIYDCDIARNEFVSARAAELLGYGQSAWKKLLAEAKNLMHPDDASRLPEHLEELARHPNGGPVEFEYRMRHADGSWRWFLSRDLVHKRKPDGSISKILGAAIEITARKHSEELLVASEHELALMFAVTHVGIAQADLHSRRIVRVNAAMCAITGYSDEELLGMTADELNHPDDRIQFLGFWKRLEKPGPGYDVEKRYLRKDGSEIWVHVTANSIADASGKPYRAVAVVRDISAQKSAQEALRRSEAEFRTLTDLMPGIAWAAPPLGGANYANEQWYEYTGTSRDRPVGEVYGEVIHPKDRKGSAIAWARAQREGSDYRIEERLRNKEGQYRWFLTRSTPIRDAKGTILRWFGVSVDVHDAKVRQRELRDSEERFRVTFETAPVGMTHAAPDGRWLRVNDAFLEIVGYGRDELLAGMTIGEVTHPEDRERDRALVNEVLSGKRQTYALEKRYVHKDGRHIHVAVSVAAVRQPDGTPDYLISSVQDISERKWTEEKLRAAAELDAYRVKLTDALRPLQCADEIRRTAARLLGEQLKADCTYLAYVDADDQFIIEPENCHASGHLAQLKGTYRLGDYGTTAAAEIAAGRPVAVSNVVALAEDGKAPPAAIIGGGVGAFIVHPLFRAGKLAAKMGVVHQLPHVWTPDEVSIVGETAERAWLAVERANAEENLRASETQFRNAANVAPAHLWISSAHGEAIFLNQRWCDYTGAAEDESLGYGWANFVHPDEQEELVQRWKNSLAKGERYEAEVRYRRADGNYRWHSVRALPQRDSTGKIVAWYGVGIDIHDAKRAENALRENERLYRSTFENAAMGIAHIGLDNRFLHVNERLCDKLGYTYDELVQKTWIDISHPDESASQLALFKGLLDGKTTNLSLEKRLLRKDGSWLWVDYTASLLRNDEGEPLYYIAFFKNIQDRKLTEEKLSESEERFRTLALTIPSVVWTAAPDGHITYANEQWFRYTGITPELNARNWPELVLHPDDREHCLRVWEQALARGSHYEVEVRNRRYDGVYRWFLTRARPLKDRTGTIVSWVGVSTDIHDQKMALEALRASEERFRLAINASRSMIYDVDLASDRRAVTYALEDVTGYRGGDAGLTSDWWHSLIHPEDLPEHLAVLEEHIKAGGRYVSEYRIQHAHGHWIWVHDDAEVIESAAGPERLVGTIVDISERKRHEEQVHLLMREVNHRSKNLLTVVQIVARQTAAATPEEFLARFSDRIQALSASQDLLVKSEWQGVALDELVESQLAHFKDLIGDRVLLKGPALRVSAAAAQTLGMALHELATNAGKYGALSNETGQVSISWRISAAMQKEPRFHFSWEEEGGPPVTAPGRRGFGSTVVENMVKLGLSADFELDYRPGGLVWRVSCTASRVLEGAKLW